MKYMIREYATNCYRIYRIDVNGNELLVTTLKTRKSAENWVAKHAW